MLLTAQRVVSPQGAHGVNVYQYIHGSHGWSRVPDEFLPDRNPGELVAQWLEIPPEGNRIVSFLDIVAPDETLPADVQQRLASLRHHLPADSALLGVYWDPYWVRFGSSMASSFQQNELGALAGHILLSLTGHRDA